MPGIAAVGLVTIIATIAEVLCGVHVPGIAAVGLEAIIAAIAEHEKANDEIPMPGTKPSGHSTNASTDRNHRNQPK